MVPANHEQIGIPTDSFGVLMGKSFYIEIETRKQNMSGRCQKWVFFSEVVGDLHKCSSQGNLPI